MSDSLHAELLGELLVTRLASERLAQVRVRIFGSSAALRPIAVPLRSLLTIMMSPITRALWLCDSGSSSLICETSFGFFGSEISTMLVP